MFRFCFLILMCMALSWRNLPGQSAALPLHAPGQWMAERFDVLSGGRTSLHTEIKGYERKKLFDLAMGLDTTSKEWSKRDQADILYLLNDNNEWLPPDHPAYRRTRRPAFKTFYKTPANFFEVNTAHFSLRANPMLHFQAGKQQGDSALLFINQRGLELRATVDQKVFFYTNLVETQARFPDYVRQRTDEFQALPGANAYKRYVPRGIDLSNAYDFHVANAHFGVHISKHVSAQIGHGTQFIGNGYRSLLLSDAGPPIFYLKLNTEIWKFHYQNLFMELSPQSANSTPGDSILQKKYMAAHYLNFRVTPRLAFGLYEAVVFNRSRQFEWQYLNPVILYRSVEAALGSPDNVLIGLNGRWDVLRRVRLYGQLMLDEFLFSALVKPEDRGWWGNKYGVQAGAHYINALDIDHLDVQAEWNYVRPYTYSHGDSLNSYTHYRQPLAHPLWANFKEVLVLVRYQPFLRWTITGRFLHANMGENTARENWGANPLLGYTSRVADYGNFTGQGVAGRLQTVGLDVTWQFYHNVFLDLKWLSRRKKSDDPARRLNTHIFTAGVRMNLYPQNYDF